MSKNKWQLVLEKDLGSVTVETFPTKEIAEEEIFAIETGDHFS